MTLPVNLQSGEEVISLVRRHPIYMVLHTIAAIVIAILVFLLAGWLKDVLPALDVLWNIIRIVAVAAAVLYFVTIFYRYQNDIWLITNQRLVDSTKPTPFNHSVSSASLNNIQDIGIEKKGILATMFDFGNVNCQTASAAGAFVLKGVPKPTEVLEVIDDARDKARPGGTKGAGV